MCGNQFCMKGRLLNRSGNQGIQRIGDYTVVKDIGSGGFATVVQVTSEKDKKTYALKIFPKLNLKSSGDVERFQHEVDTMYHLEHSNLVKMHDFFWDDRNFYLVEDYCAGGDLLDYILEQNSPSEVTAAIIFKQIILGVAHFHSYGVAHRDLKPENILIDRFPHIKICDFGLCGFIDENKLLDTFCGSPTYCSPECIAHLNYDGKLADIWSLGVLLFVLVSGETPWNQRNQVVMTNQIMRASYTIPKKVSPECQSLINSMLSIKATSRPSLQEILDHPWLRLANCANFMLSDDMKINDEPIPLKQKISLHQIAEISHKSGASDNGVFSPIPTSSDNEEVTATMYNDSEEVKKLVHLCDAKAPTLPNLPYIRPRPTKTTIPQRPKLMFKKNKSILHMKLAKAQTFGTKIDTIREVEE